MPIGTCGIHFMIVNTYLLDTSIFIKLRLIHSYNTFQTTKRIVIYSDDSNIKIHSNHCTV